jgi:hypothetical protein
VLNICVAKDKGVGEDKVEKQVVGWDGEPKGRLVGM